MTKVNIIAVNSRLCFHQCSLVWISSQILIRNRATELDSRMNDGTTPLILAARLAVEGLVEELIHCHADINAVDDHGKRTFIHSLDLWNIVYWFKWRLPQLLAHAVIRLQN